MPRPSLKNERRAEILAAYERCIARHGVEGATLERIAEEAGLARALIRHNVGNKDELFASFLDRYLERASADVDDLFESLPETDRIPTLLEWLFDPAYASTSEVSVTNALITAALDDRALAERLNAWSAEFVAGIDRELKDAYPRADTNSRDAVAHGVVGIYFNFDTMALLDRSPALRRSSLRAAELLISVLDRSSG